jgi:hypothetical protein
MKKALWFLLLIAVVLLGDRAFGYLLKNRLENSQFRYSRMYTGKAQADILLVGNSRGLPLSQPSIEAATGQSTFNLSYNGAPAYLLEALTLDYLDKYPAPKTAIIELTLADRPNNSLLAGFGAYLPYSDRIGALLKDSLPKEYNAAQLFHLYRYNSEVFHRTLFYGNRSDEDWLAMHTISEVSALDANAKPYALEIHPKLVQSVANTVKALQSKGTRVHLVIAPYAPNYASKVTNLDALKQNIEVATGLTSHDYRALLTDFRDFSDYMHPNLSGSQKYVEQLKADGLF